MSICGPGQLGRYSDSLGAGRSADRIPMSARFSTLVQTGPVALSASPKMGTGSLYRDKRPGLGFDQSPTFSAEVKEDLHGLL